MPITIRRATTDDADAISAVWEAVCAERIYTAVNRPFTPQQERDFIASLSDREGLFVAEVDGEVAGFQSIDLWAKYTDSFDHVGVMGSIISPQWRRKGIGQCLAEHTLTFARANGYEKIWLVGVSMGGLGSLLYLKEHPENIDGILTLGPKLDANFIGNGAIIDEIATAGGVDNWEPGNYDPDDDWPRMLWAWLKTYNHDSTNAPPIYLGIGTEDGFFKAQNLLASDLPQDRVIFVEGGHRFSTFKKIWDIFLDRQILQ